MAEEPWTGGDPVILAPETFQRHADAVSYIEQSVRVNRPLVGRGRTTWAAPGAWGFLAAGATITGASGLTLGTGTVELCTRAGATLTGTGENVTVYNSCDAITAPAGGMAIALLWTDCWSIG